MGVSLPDAHPAGNLPGACKAAHCHCPLLFQGDLTNIIDREPAFFSPYLYVQKNMGKREAQSGIIYSVATKLEECRAEQTV